ncbi:hypothetical protein P171DRAFT_487083 [Karstenula rhodostoma CBS 690.94]|uniref:Uncharacterized protein n=1 Tax=Karstenula rhodostoma CBS 690.94 TaxID=1392251 RepID=A0A9P4PHL5_9PLEO|nr:hypothetical protein P171DRAFT_487083 [Karstenula rhodostoma CBS 690.94]
MAAIPTLASISDALQDCGDSHASQWLRYLHRTADLVNLSFSTERESMFNHVLRDHGVVSGMPYLTFECLSAPAAQKPFCDPRMDNTIKLRALYLGQCVHSVILSTPLLTYLSNDCGFRICEYDIHVSPKVATWCTNKKEYNNWPLHSVLFLAPSFLPTTATASDPFKDPGMILDPSSSQMGFEETISCAKKYFRDKFESFEGHSSRPLGSHLSRFKADLLTSPSSMHDHYAQFRQEISLRAICNVLYEEVEQRMGGAKAVINLEEPEWKRFLEALGLRLEHEMGQLRTQLDNIEFAGCEEDMEYRGRQLMSQYDKEGYRNMIAPVPGVILSSDRR